MLQKDLFLDGEGNQYFRRNETDEVKINRVHEELYKGYTKYLSNGKKVLEIGCCDGHNLFRFSEEKGCLGYGIDPSEDAIQKGKKDYPTLNLYVGTADKLDFPDETFDLVLFGFCLYLVDRKLLAKVIAEADRVLKDGGFIGITDFDVKIPKKRNYKYYQDMYSYKYEYSKLFLAYPQYTLVEKWNKPSNEAPFIEDISERTASTVLFKNYHNAYFDETDV